MKRVFKITLWWETEYGAPWSEDIIVSKAMKEITLKLEMREE